MVSSQEEIEAPSKKDRTRLELVILIFFIRNKAVFNRVSKVISYDYFGFAFGFTTV